MTPEDRTLGMDRPISRREFVEGAAVVVGALAAGPLLAACGDSSPKPAATTGEAPPPGGGAGGAGTYPPALTGLRGSTDEALGPMHAVRDGTFFAKAGDTTSTGEQYDLVVIGGGISGLSAAYFYLRDVNKNAKVLIIENHDDVGGHARRNEFDVDGTRLIGYGGTQSLEAPALYSAQAKRLLDELGIDTTRFETEWYDQEFQERHGLSAHTFYDRETFGSDVLVRDDDPLDAQLAKLPIADAAKADLKRLVENPPDPFPNLAPPQKAARLADMTYADFVTKRLKMHPDVVKVHQQYTHSEFGLGVEAVSALDCYGLGFVPGFDGMKLGGKIYPGMGLTPQLQIKEEQDYIYHFPDGNAGVVRALIHALVPAAFPAATIEQQVLANIDYAQFDVPSNPVRIRLRSSVVRVRHIGGTGSGSEVEVTYSRDGTLASVRAGAVVAACWHVVSARIIEGLTGLQVGALKDQVKVPLVYTNVAIRNWKAFKELGIYEVFVAGPGPFWHFFQLDYPVSIGDYKFSPSPDRPAVIHMESTPNAPGMLPPRSQLRAGRGKLFGTPFEAMERSARDLLQRVLGPGGFSAADDIAAITVNRWGHGYAYEYARPWDAFFPKGPLPITTARARFGRVVFANADSGAYAYTNSAMDQAYRAVQELARVE